MICCVVLRCDAMSYLLLAALHLHQEVGGAIVGQGLPRLDVVHLRLHQPHVLQVAVSVQYSVGDLWSTQDNSQTSTMETAGTTLTVLPF